jgi:hypothetical protein
MSVACLRAIDTKGFCAASPYLVLISWPPVIYAADEWWRTAPELRALNLLTRIDVPALAAYCHAYGQWRLAADAQAKMAANDPPVMNGGRADGLRGTFSRNRLANVGDQLAITQSEPQI